MPQYLRGDIFKTAIRDKYDLAIVFGHTGFNEMGLTWRQFCEQSPAAADVTDPFRQCAREQAIQLKGCWFWFVPNGANHGMTDEQLKSEIERAVVWAEEHLPRSAAIITNGIAETGKDADHDHRARFLKELAAGIEGRGFRVTLISLNDVFVRQMMDFNTCAAARIAWYGERGIINALVTEIARRPQPVEEARSLLRAIRWADGREPNWIGNLASVCYIVETALAEFGSPDLILVARCDADVPYVVFIEGKVKPYELCAMPNHMGMAIRSFNSKINGQLALRYRFSEALRAWDGETPQIVEPRFLWMAYHRLSADGGLGDPFSHPRHLQKRSVLRLLRSHHLHGLPASHYHFVTLTHDYNPYWDQGDVLAGDLLPCFLNPLPDGDRCWDTMLGRTGCLTYVALEERLQPGNEYREALSTMESVARERTPTLVHDDSLPAGRSRKGVSVVFVPGFRAETASTAVHFSWFDNSAVIRIYGNDCVPTVLACATLDVLSHIAPMREKPFGSKNRPAWTEVESWQRIINELNLEWEIE